MIVYFGSVNLCVTDALGVLTSLSQMPNHHIPYSYTHTHINWKQKKKYWLNRTDFQCSEIKKKQQQKSGDKKVQENFVKLNNTKQHAIWM